MNYFSLLHLQKEPFSNSPDPEMFFQSTQHLGCLQKLEIAIRLKRGLSVVVGDIGTGKSTLCRQLIQRLSQGEGQILPFLILDPEFSSPVEFLRTIAKTFGLDCAHDASEWQLKDAIKNTLFEQSIHQHKIPLLIIDEGQKLPGFCIEILREFLNYETNQFKLLQIVIFAQEEFKAIFRQKANFADRIATYHYLKPLSLADTWAMIDFRLKKSHAESETFPPLFSRGAMLAIYWLTRGYPRRIVMLCSKVVLRILVDQKKQAGVKDVFRAARETVTSQPGNRHWVLAATILVLGCAALFYYRNDFPSRTPITAPITQPPQTVEPSPPPKPPPIAQEPLALIEPIPAPPEPAVPTVAAPIEEHPEVPPPPPAPPEPALPAPSSLGQVEVEKGVVISKMIARVYGRYSPSKLAMLLEANPHITTPDHIEVKTVVTFPVLPNTDLSGQHREIWIELLDTPHLSEAYAVLKNYPETMAPPLLIRPVVTDANTFRFHVTLEESFTDEQAALARLEKLPQEWRARATVSLP